MRWGPSGGGPSPAAGPRGLPPLLPLPRAAARLLTDVSALSPQLTTLRGAILEDAIPSTARHGTARGLPLREVLEYLVPELSTQCLRQAPSSPRVAEQLLRLDEQGVCAAPSSPVPLPYDHLSRKPRRVFSLASPRRARALVRRPDVFLLGRTPAVL